EATERALFDALQRKAGDEVRELTSGIAQPELAAMLSGLVELSGDAETLERAHVLLKGAPENIMVALDELAEIARVLDRRYPQVALYFDLGEQRGYHHHTEVTFAAFIPGTGQSIAQGGRYDEI